MNLLNTIGDKTWRVLTDQARDISIPLVFNGEQPSFFGAPAASATSLQLDGFTGDTRQGGSCNVGHYQLVPHCNGTHTESLGHIVNDDIFIAETIKQLLLPTTLLTITPVSASLTDETSLPTPSPTSQLITAGAIKRALQEWPEAAFRKALVIRTEPNTAEKTERHYHPADPPPFFSMEAMELIVSYGVEHLLVDIPSLDSMNDDGKLTTHRIFWQLPPGSHDARHAERPQCSVTEMIYAPNEIPDGYYCLNLQLPPFMTDAAPSRPLLYPVEK